MALCLARQMAASLAEMIAHPKMMAPCLVFQTTVSLSEKMAPQKIMTACLADKEGCEWGCDDDY